MERKLSEVMAPIIGLVVALFCILAIFMGYKADASGFSNRFYQKEVIHPSGTVPKFYLHVYVDRDTGVEYIMSNTGGLSPIYNADGTIRTVTVDKTER